MPKGIPASGRRSDIAPLSVKRLTNAPLVRIGAFKSMQERKNDRTGETEEIEQVKLSLDFDSGHVMQNEEGEPVLDQNDNEQPHYINEGFVTLSGNEKAKLVVILKALGLDDERFIEREGRGAGGLTVEAAESLEARFGVNGLGNDYSGQDWDDLPFYVLPRDGGKESKRDVEVPVISLKILGYQIIGRWLDMALTIKNGYNRVESYFPSEESAPLGEPGDPIPDPPSRRKAPARGMAKQKARSTQAAATKLDGEIEGDPFPPKGTDAEPAPTSGAKHVRYTRKVLTEAGVPEPFHVRVAQLMSGGGNDDFMRLDDMPLEHGRNFRDMHKDDDTLVQTALKTAMGEADTAPFDATDEDDEDF